MCTTEWCGEPSCVSYMFTTKLQIDRIYFTKGMRERLI